MPRSSWCDLSCCYGGNQNRPFTKLSVTWKSSTSVFLARCIFHPEVTSVAFPGRHNCILIIMQVKCGAVVLWCGCKLTSHCFKRNSKIKTGILEEGILDVIWVLSWLRTGNIAGYPVLPGSADTDPNTGQGADFCPAVFFEMNVIAGS